MVTCECTTELIRMSEGIQVMFPQYLHTSDFHGYLLNAGCAKTPHTDVPHVLHANANNANQFAVQYYSRVAARNPEFVFV